MHPDELDAARDILVAELPTQQEAEEHATYE